MPTLPALVYFLGGVLVRAYDRLRGISPPRYLRDATCEGIAVLGIGHDFFEWYGGLTPWIRFSVAGLFLVVGGLTLWLTNSFWGFRLGIGAVAIGMILLIFAFPNDAERKGYQDF